jgi:conjugative transfer signal peptidase TraF
VITGIAISMTLVCSTWGFWGPQIIVNPTVSEPQGFYRLVSRSVRDYQRGMTVVFPVPHSFQGLVYGRGWLKTGVPLLKHIGALTGDQVCIRNDTFTVNGRVLGPVSSVDATGAPLPRLRGCFEIEPGYFLPVGEGSARSFDGRYIGPQPLSSITAEARALWTF